MGIRKRDRLKRPEDFARLRREGRVFRHRYLLLSLLPNRLGYNRYGIVTSKRLGGAVVRNHTRRLLREALRRAHPQLCQGYDLVIVAHPGSVGQSLAALEAALHTVFGAAALWASRDE